MQLHNLGGKDMLRDIFQYQHISTHINTQQDSAHVLDICAQHAQSACGSEMQKLLADHADHSDVATSLRARTAARYVSPSARSAMGRPLIPISCDVLV